MTFVSSLAATLGLALIAASPAASCEQETLAHSTEPHLEPLSVPAPEVGTWLTASPYSSGIRFTSVMHGHDLWLDIIDFPERAPELGSIRALMQLGRVASDDFERLVLVDGQEALFVVAEEDLRSVGCQFVWPVNDGTNPIGLMRSLVEAIREEDGGHPIEGLSATGLAATAIQAVAIVQDHFIQLGSGARVRVRRHPTPKISARTIWLGLGRRGFKLRPYRSASRSFSAASDFGS